MTTSLLYSPSNSKGVGTFVQIPYMATVSLYGLRIMRISNVTFCRHMIIVQHWPKKTGRVQCNLLKILVFFSRLIQLKTSQMTFLPTIIVYIKLKLLFLCNFNILGIEWTNNSYSPKVSSFQHPNLTVKLTSE